MERFPSTSTSTRRNGRGSLVSVCPSIEVLRCGVRAASSGLPGCDSVSDSGICGGGWRRVACGKGAVTLGIKPVIRGKGFRVTWGDNWVG